jgi:tRNA pseudouridine38-40 synthase
MPRYRLLVSYDGTEFHGWQRQEPPGKEPLRTVQGVLEEAVRAAFRLPTRVVGASRTDAGVHAVGQVMAFTAAVRVPPERMAWAINARLPQDVQTREARIVVDDFDPITDAVSKSYRYSILVPSNAERLPALFDLRHAWWHVQPLSLQAMNAAAARIVGEHDFAAFAHASHGRESTVRRVTQCVVTSPAPGRIAIDVAGNGFLYNMVRIIAGTLVEVGRGRRTPDDVARAVDEQDKRLTGQTLPPQGLCLQWIHYGGRDEPVP